MVLVLAACGRGDESRSASANTAAPASVTAASGATTAAGKPACPHTGQWSPCTLFERLDRMGLAPRVDSGMVTVSPFSVPAHRLHVGASDIDAMIYSDARAREADEKRLDRAAYVEYDAPLGMKPLPTIIRSANLIVILHSRNDHQRERVSDAITAGPPQP